MAKLFVIGTPIGNLGDITFRAIETLKNVDYVAAEDTRHHSLLQLSDNEVKAIKDFRDKHYKKCAEPLHSKAAGNTYIYELTGTGLGTCIKITCPICGETEDVTDTDSW